MLLRAASSGSGCCGAVLRIVVSYIKSSPRLCVSLCSAQGALAYASCLCSVQNRALLLSRCCTPLARAHQSCTAAVQDLGYSPNVPLSEGVQRFCKWFISYYDIRDGKPANIADFNYNPL